MTKQTNSAFYGEPDIHAWLQDRDLTGFAVCRIQANHRLDPSAELPTADEPTRAPLTSLNGDFATVVDTAHLTKSS